MSWRIIATVTITVFAIIIGQAVLIGPLHQTADAINETGDYSDNGHFDGNSLIYNIVYDWANMGLIAIFGVMLWGSWRIVRKELTRGRL